MLRLKRIYDLKSEEDGYRILVDKIWPRGMSKENAEIDEWDKEMAPDAVLRKRFHSGEIDFNEFRNEYLNEIKSNPKSEEFKSRVRLLLANGSVTLLFASKDTKHNQAVILRDWLL